MTTIDLSATTGLPTGFNYKVPDGSDIAIRLNDLTGAFTQVNANETGGTSYQIDYNTAPGVAIQTDFWSGQNETGTQTSAVVGLLTVHPRRC